MGLARISKPKEEEEEKKPFTIVRKAAQPIIAASREFHHTHPQEFLLWITLLLFLICSFILEIVSNLPWGWYLIFTVFIVFYNFDKLKNIKKKKRR